jgi:MFS family permease
MSGSTLLSSPRSAIMAAFAAFGSIIGTVSGSAPQLIAQHGLDNAIYGLGITLMSAATVGSMGISGTLARHVSHRVLLLTILPILLVSLWFLLGQGSVVEFFVFSVIYGIASGITDVIMNAEAGAIEQAQGKRIYIMFHGMGSTFVALFAILSSFLSTSYGTPVSVAATALPVTISMILVFTNIRRSKPEPLPAVSERKILSAFTPRLVLIGITAGFVISCEITALMWSSELLAQSAPQLAAIAGLGAAFFGLSNALLRFPGDWLRTHFNETSLMSVLMLVAAIGFAGLGLSEGFVANIAFFALVGMGVAILCPCLFAMAGRETPHNRAAGLSVAMLVAGIPRIVMPTIIGAIAQIYSTRVAFGLCAVALICALVVVRRLAKHDAS